MPVFDLTDLPAACPPDTPWIGLDLGENTIGVAVSDTSRMIASPLQLIRKVKFSQDAEQLIKLMNGRNVSALVIGLPLNMDGTPSDFCARAQKFANRLNGRFNLPVFTHDERLTTFEAKGERMARGGQRGSYRDNPVDAIAAALLLQGWLDAHAEQA